MTTIREEQRGAMLLPYCRGLGLWVGMTRLSDVFLEFQVVIDAGGEFLLVVRHHDEGFMRPLAECLDDLLYPCSIGDVEAVQWFVEDEELRVLHEGAC